MLKYEFYPMRRGIGGCFRKSFTPGGGLLLRSTMWFYISCTLEHDNASGELACSGGKCTAKERIGQPTVNFRRSGKPLPLPALGFSADEFVSAYTRNRDHLADLALEASPVASALVAFMSARDTWTGSSSELLGRLADTSPGAAGSQAWPKSAKGLLGALRRVAPALRAAGVTVEHGRTEYARTVTVCKARLEVSDVSDVSGSQQEQRFEAEPQSVRMRQPKRQDVSDVSAETRVPDASDASDTLKPALHAQWEGPL